MGLVFGVGEFLGYGLRLLIAVPLMGFTQNWNLLIVLILLERIGKALRNPVKDTILSSVAEHQVGIGQAFGLQEALDQLGAFAGPLILTAVFALTGRTGIAEYQLGYRLLIIPLIALMLFLMAARRKIQRERLIPEMNTRGYHRQRLPRIFWVYTLFTFVTTMGFLNFSISGYHVKAAGIMGDGEITFLYSLAMAVDAAASLLTGWLYDKVKDNSGRQSGGLILLAMIPLLTMLMPLLTLSRDRTAIIAGMVIFGVVMGTHETIMRSAIAYISPYDKRGTSYGIFNAVYGAALLIGSSVMGLLYDGKLISMIRTGTVAVEILAVLVFLYLMKMVNSKANTE